MADNSPMPSKPRSNHAPLSQALALAMVVSWSVCALADASVTSTLLTPTGGSSRLGGSGSQGELRSIEQWKGHLKLAARQFRLHPAPDWWLHGSSSFIALLPGCEPSLLSGQNDVRGLLHHQAGGLARLLSAHHVNLPPPSMV